MKKKDLNIEKTINDIFYLVDLTYGQVHTRLKSLPTESGPYRECRNLIEADLYSLNILRQNVNETEFKTGSKPFKVSREFLGNHQMIETSKIIPTMKWLRETYPEKLL